MIATTRAGAKPAVEALGAQIVVDVDAQRFEDVAREVDLVLDVLAGETQTRSWQTRRRDGLLVTTLMIEYEGQASARGVRTASFSPKPDGTNLFRIAGMMNAGALHLKRCREADFPQTTRFSYLGS